VAAAVFLVVGLASAPPTGAAELPVVAGALVGELAALVTVGGALLLALVAFAAVGLELWPKTPEVQEKASKVMMSAWKCLFIG
jgi:hypothetical protein